MTTHTLMPVLDINNVFTDGFLIDDTGSIAFLSLIGKDTAIQEFRARWSLPVTQGGLTDFQVETPDGAVRLNLGSPESLEFLAGRLQTSIFGNLVQVFVYKHLAQKPDFANRRALQLFQSGNERLNSIWTLVKDISPLPLLDQWKEVILEIFEKKQWLQKLPGMGGIFAYSVSIPEDELTAIITANIQSGALLAKANEKGDFFDETKVTLSKPQALIDLENELGPTVDNIEDEIFGKPISVYTRSQAIDDGFLVDVSGTDEAKEAGFVVPVALTREVWNDYVEWPKEKGGQDEKGRLWDILYMAKVAISGSKDRGNVLHYKLYCVPHDSIQCDNPEEVTLKLVSGPGDNGEHVITIMKPNES